MAHRRRGVGMAGLAHQKAATNSYKAVGSDISKNQVEVMTQQLGDFQKNLEEFANKYRKEINKNPEFRKHFQDMCVNIGVDPLASNKGFWSELLGVGDFYYELGVQVIEAGLRTRNSNGGLMELKDCLEYIMKMRSKKKKAQKISEDDIERAVQKLEILGGGLRIVKVGKRKLIQFVPLELDNDHAQILDLASKTGWVTKSQIAAKLGWGDMRIEKVLQPFLRQSMTWVDDQEGERQFWFPSLLHMF
mmetsp:Transcript_7951/g.13793  ORF Transcript_7951/g.13793 Transcript_7951/m.13793 type:complete len:247 (-) Transcript_7951:236-976(-)